MFASREIKLLMRKCQEHSFKNNRNLFLFTDGNKYHCREGQSRRLFTRL